MMKSIVVLLLVVSGVGADLEAMLGRSASEPNPLYAKYQSLLQEPQCLNADNNALDETGMARWEECKIFIMEKLSGRSSRSLQQLASEDFGINDDRDGTVANGTSADFVEPCYALPETTEDRLSEGWITTPFADDGTELMQIPFTFKMYGREHTTIQVDANGAITFGEIQHYVPFFALDFPNAMIDMVAPFWSDVDVRTARNGESQGSIWWKIFDNNHLAVVWDNVGWAAGNNPTNKRNTFQAVISDGDINGRLGPSNVCFCYIDMLWWKGQYDWIQAAATVGLSSTKDLSTYVQVGRFGTKGDEYDGPFGNVDGVNWLDYKGSNRKRTEGQVDPIQGLCFQTGNDLNIPPVPSGFPTDDTYNIPCRGKLEMSLAFSTPENNQFIILTDPANITDMQALGLTYIRSATEGDTSIQVSLNWTPDFTKHAGTYKLVFIAEDNLGARITKTLTINVAMCGMGADIPTGCVPIEGNTCTEGDPQPYCTPYRSPEHCPMDESFPSYIRTRQQILKDSPSTLEDLGYWFHYLQDKAAAYAFTASSGYHAPKILCCADPSDWLATCFPVGGPNATSFVIRAVGDQHSNSAVYVLPNGFGGSELSRPMAFMTAAQVAANIAGLTSPPTKIIVEEFISGSSTENTLPNEYKIHAFDGTVGSINMVLNRNSDCACYAEVDMDWNRLDTNGCFTPNMPFGLQGEGTCYAVEMQQGAKRPFQMKGHDLCGSVPLLSPSCLLAELVQAAEKISKILGVYVRIDFFISADNKLYVQEYTFNHNNGLRHCSSKVDDETGCIDSCFLGRMWKDNGATENERIMGGPVTPVPAVLAGWGAAGVSAQCTTATSTALPSPHVSCAGQ